MDPFGDRGWPDLITGEALRYQILLIRFVGVKLVNVIANHQSCVSHSFGGIGCSEIAPDSAKEPASLSFDFSVLDNNSSQIMLGILFNDGVFVSWPVRIYRDVTHDGFKDAVRRG